MKNTMLVSTATAAVTLALAIGLVGCGGNAAGQGETSGGSPSAEAAAPAEAQGKAEVHIETEGMGGIAWAYEDDEVVFDEDRSYQSAYVGDAYGQTIHIEARDCDDYEGWHFVKWTKDGADFSTDNRIDVLVDGDVEYVAVFDFEQGRRGGTRKDLAFLDGMGGAAAKADAADLREVGAFAYRAEFGNGLCEYEYDHVLVGRCEGGSRARSGGDRRGALGGPRRAGGRAGRAPREVRRLGPDGVLHGDGGALHVRRMGRNRITHPLRDKL